MSHDNLGPGELLERAARAERAGDLDRACEYYQRIVDEAPYSKPAKKAGERLMQLQEDGESVQSPDASGMVEVDDEAFDRESGEVNREASEETTNDTLELTCTQCGGKAFISGVVAGEYDSYFHPDNDSWMDALFPSGRPVDAYACRSCGTIIERVTDISDDESSS